MKKRNNLICTSYSATNQVDGLPRDCSFLCKLPYGFPWPSVADENFRWRLVRMQQTAKLLAADRSSLEVVVCHDGRIDYNGS